MVRRTGPGKRPRRPGFTLTEMAVVLAIVAATALLIPPLLPQIQVTKNAPPKSPQQIATEATMKRLGDIINGTPDWPGYWHDNLSSAGDTTLTPLTLKDLFAMPATTVQSTSTAMQAFAPCTGRGWRGPYVLYQTATYTVNTQRGFTAGAYPNQLNANNSYALTANPAYLAPAGAGTIGFGQNGDPAMLDGWGNPIVIQWPTDTAGVNVQPSYVRLVSAGPNGTLDTRLTDLTAIARGDDIVLFLRMALP
jgi:prepilin-type N-terminal cleavage/methylation domain-containing protein